jgi:hypothetical protein
LYEPSPFGFERDIAKRLQWWSDLKDKLQRQEEDPAAAQEE